LDALVHAESGWYLKARTGDAYGLGQAKPGSKMRAAERPKWGPKWDDWRTDWRVQMTWIVRYVRARYGTMKRARAHQIRWSWY